MAQKTVTIITNSEVYQMKTKLKMKTLALATLLFAVSSPSNAGGGGVPFTGATEWTQLLNNVELGSMYSAELETMISNANQLQQQIRMYQNMIQNTISLPQNLWSDAVGDFNQLRSIVERTGAMAQEATNIDSYMNGTYNSYAAFNANTSMNYGQEYDKWSQASQKAIIGSLSAAKMTFDQVSDEASFIQQLDQASSSAEGQKQVIQAANQIAIEQVKQTQKLRTLIASQMQAQAEFMAKQNAKEDYMAARSAEAAEIVRNKTTLDTSQTNSMADYKNILQ